VLLLQLIVQNKGKIMELNQGDIQNLMVVIDLATQRGLFKAQDLIAIGTLYEKLNKIKEAEESKKVPNPE